MADQYRGMRWLKCDLQMQTPADARHWLGDRMLVGEEESAAMAFAEACYQIKLDVVGITDHNFLGKDFLPLLRNAFNQIESEYGHKITMFPGFEFEAAGVGRGVHVLCFFEPDSDLAKIDAILTECGIAYPRVKADGELEKSDKNLKEIIQIVQTKNSGIVIMPHAMSNDGLFDNDSISEWLQKDQFTNPDLLAVEVPKPISKMSVNFQKLFHSEEDCQPGWRRIRPIATLMSSDNKKLIELDASDAPTPNSIGYRYSWIKMSKPSIESLRQAFLDHQSRIRLPENVVTDLDPNELQRQARIVSIKVKDADFLADQEVLFSPNLNCVIGGRGSGKSTLLEYMRLILQKNHLSDIDDDTRSRIERIKRTISESDTEIEIQWINSDGVEDTIILQNGESIVQGRDLADPETFFGQLPIRFYSQQQLNRITDASNDNSSGGSTAQRLLGLIDSFVKDELAELKAKEDASRIDIEQRFAKQRQVVNLNQQLKKFQQEHQELERQWTARKEIQQDVKTHQLLQDETYFVKKLKTEIDEDVPSILALTKNFIDAHTSIPGNVEEWPHKDWFKSLDADVVSAKERLYRAVQSATDEYENEIKALFSGDQWNGIKEELEHSGSKFQEACKERGLSPEDVGRLQEIDKDRQIKKDEIDRLILQISQLSSTVGDINAAMERHHKIWQDQFVLRQEAAQKANDIARLQEGQQFLDVLPEYFGDKEDFNKKWDAFAPLDRRTRLGREWDAIGDYLYSNFKDRGYFSPWAYMHGILLDSTICTEPLVIDRLLELTEHVNERSEDWERLYLSRVGDAVDITLFRPDGSQAGKISDGSLSDGQRNTVALALLLAQDDGPLIIDQPEDELDSNFVFKELIPMLRNVKNKRQLILATHNANLAVNGDAELIYAFEANSGRGLASASGGLDQQDVTEAVLNIMEGSAEAFRRRREKYHF